MQYSQSDDIHFIVLGDGSIVIAARNPVQAVYIREPLIKSIR